MGKFDFTFNVKLTQKLEKLNNFDEIAEQMLTESVPILERHVKSEVSKYKDTGDMLDSIRHQKKPKKNDHGWYTAVIPTGEDRHGVRNMEKMAHLEYGTSKIPPKPIISKALNDAREEVNEKMQEVFDKVVNE